jgi:hypothetical protein
MYLFAALSCLVFATGIGLSAPVLINQPAGDRWMYWMGDGVGSRQSASVYGAYGSFDYISQGYDFDDRHAQMLVDFDTTAIAQPGRGVGNYTIHSLVLTVVVNEDLQFVYDPSHDPLGSYRGTVADEDTGRPLELFGVGYRGGWNLATFRENSPYQSNNATGYKNVRNAYAMDFVGGQARDVSNNVEMNFETSPWAVGQITGILELDGSFTPSPLNAGQSVPQDAVVEFTVNLSNTQVREYIQQGLHAGRLQFMVTSLLGYTYTGNQGESGGFPSFYTKESIYHLPGDGIYLAAQLEGDVSIQATAAHRPIVSISSASQTGMKISFTSQSGHSYQVQSKDNLSDLTWTNRGSPLNGTGNLLEHTDTPPVGTRQRFYRVLSTRN